jgi:hypothetical protein
MSTGTLNTGQVKCSNAPSEGAHVLRKEDYNNWCIKSTVSLSSGTTDGSVTLGAIIFSQQIVVNLATHTGAYTAKLSILATNTYYRGPILVKVVAADDNPKFELYDDSGYTSLVFEIDTFVSGGETVYFWVIPNGTGFEVKA